VVTVVVIVVAHCCDGGWARLLLRHAESIFLRSDFRVGPLDLKTNLLVMATGQYNVVREYYVVLYSQSIQNT